MNKKEMAGQLAKKAEISQAKALEVLNIIFSAKGGEGLIAGELDGGGMVVATGTPEDVANVEASHTGRFLQPLLQREPEPA